ncbi:hypothetical protein ACFL6P_09680 [Candidatus Latescibacterota bacterium]
MPSDSNKRIAWGDSLDCEISKLVRLRHGTINKLLVLRDRTLNELIPNVKKVATGGNYNLEKRLIERLDEIEYKVKTAESALQQSVYILQYANASGDERKSIEDKLIALEGTIERHLDYKPKFEKILSGNESKWRDALDQRLESIENQMNHGWAYLEIEKDVLEDMALRGLMRVDLKKYTRQMSETIRSFNSIAQKEELDPSRYIPDSISDYWDNDDPISTLPEVEYPQSDFEGNTISMGQSREAKVNSILNKYK